MVQTIKPTSFSPSGQARISPTAKRIPTTVLKSLPKALTDARLAAGIKNQNFLPMITSGEAYVRLNDLPLALESIGALSGHNQLEAHDQLGTDAKLAYATVAVKLLRQTPGNPNLHNSAILIMDQIKAKELKLPIQHAPEALDAMVAFDSIPALKPHVKKAKERLDQQIANALETQTPDASPSSSYLSTTVETGTLIGANNHILSLSTCCAQTHIGKRGSNEDTAFLAKIEDEVVLGVFDGLGGHANGGEASAAAVTTIETFVKANPKNPDLTSALLIAQDKVREVPQDELGKRPDTTAVIAKVSDNIATIHNIGDSRAFLIRNGKLYIITRDHTGFTDTLHKDNLEFLSGFFNRSKLDKLKKPEGFRADDSYADYTEEYYTFTMQELRNMGSSLIKDSFLAITRSVAQDKDIPIDEFQIELENNDIQLLCSDGIHDYLPYDVFAAGAAQFSGMSNQEIANYLIEQTNQQNNERQDNITVAVYRHEQITEAPVVEDSGISPVFEVEEDESPPPFVLNADEQKEMGEHTQEELIFTTDELDAEAAAEEAVEEPVYAHPMTEAERRANPDPTIIGELEQPPIVDLGLLEDEEPVAVPATQPELDPRTRAAGEMGSDTLIKEVGRITGSMTDPNRPRGQQEGHIDFEEGVATTLEDLMEMGDPMVVGTDGLKSGEVSLIPPTGPLAVLMQEPGPTTSQQTIMDALMEIVTDPTIVSTDSDITNLLMQLSKFEVFFVTDEDMLGQIAFTRLVLLDQLKELKGEE